MRCSKETEHLFRQRLQDKGWKAPKPASIQVCQLLPLPLPPDTVAAGCCRPRHALLLLKSREIRTYNFQIFLEVVCRKAEPVFC